MTIKTTVTAQAIWDKLMEDADFAAQPATVLEATRPFVDAMPEVLSAQLDQPFTVASYLETKMVFAKYCLEHDYLSKLVEAMPPNAIDGFDSDELLEMLTGILTELVSAFGTIAHDVAAFLTSQGITEAELLLSPNVGLNAELAQQYQAGLLTIGDVLVQQPMIIFKNT